MVSLGRLRLTMRERAGANPTEHTEAVRFMRVVRLHEARYPALKWLHAIPNGGWRKKAVAKKLKAEGVRKGVHDYCWPFRAPAPDFITLPNMETGTHYSGLYIELKSMDGKARKEQKQFAEFAESQGFKVVFAHGWEEAWRAVCDYAGIPFNVV